MFNGLGILTIHLWVLNMFTVSIIHDLLVFITRHVRFANRADIETAGPGLRTAPPSTRVSLPTDTADHAPNFLSPSTAEPSEVTPLIN